MREHIKPHKLEDILQEGDLWIKNLKNTERIMNFCSAIFAFTVTLLIIQIDVPIDWTEKSLHDEFIFIWPGIAGYVICFYVIIRFWMNHLRIFSYIKILNRNFLYLNCLFLLTVTFLPFPSDLFGTHFNKITTTMIFGLSISAVCLMSFFVWLYLYLHPELHHKDIDARILSYHAYQNLSIALAFFVACIFLYYSQAENWFWLFFIFFAIIFHFLVKQIARHKTRNS